MSENDKEQKMPLPKLNKLCKWRMVLAGWHAGTKTVEQGGAMAMRDLMDKWLIMRTENSALAQLLIKKGVFTAYEYAAEIEQEAEILDKALESVFPGFSTTEVGVEITDLKVALETMRRKRFPA